MEQDINKMKNSLSKSFKAIESINKSDLVEMKAFGKPPVNMNLIIEAVCILFDKKPNFDNYKQMLGSFDILHSLMTFDKEKINEQMLDRLEPYINNPLFTPENLIRVSKVNASLCEWIRGMYEYGLLKKNYQAKLKNGSKNCATLIEYIEKNSCYSFAWPCFYPDLYENDDKITEINSIIETKFVNLMPFLSYQDYFDQFESNPDLLKLTVTDYSSLPLKLISSNASQVLFLFDLFDFCCDLNIKLNFKKGKLFELH